jgi:cation transport protein ChaC
MKDWNKALAVPEGEDFWVFGYGSLIWHPGFPHVEVRSGVLEGYHRHFCVYSHRYRGTPDCPGLVLGLDRGGFCQGLVFRVPAAEAAAVMQYLDEREMVTNVYQPGWYDVSTDKGTVSAITFVADPQHKQYAGRLPHPELLQHIVQGCGERGTCRDYLENTVQHLTALGLHDEYLSGLLSEVDRAES